LTKSIFCCCLVNIDTSFMRCLIGDWSAVVKLEAQSTRRKEGRAIQFNFNQTIKQS